MLKQRPINHFSCLTQLVLAATMIVPLASGMNIAISEKMISREQRLPHYALIGNREEVKKLIDEEAPIDAKGLTGHTGLHGAAHRGHEEVVSLLLQNGARTDVGDKNGLTALHGAALGGYVRIVELLLNYGADVDEINLNGSTPLMCAVSMKHECVVRLLCERKASLTLENKNGYNALHIAASNGAVKCVRILLDFGAVPTEKAIAAAKKGNHYDIFALLLRKAQINLTPEIVQFLPSLHVAADADLREVVHYLCSMKCPELDALDKAGHAPLHYAASKSRIIVINRLIDGGANPDLFSTNGYTPLHLTVGANKELAARILIARGAKLDSGNRQENRTPLHFAAMWGKPSFAKLLISKGADVDAIAEDDTSVVHFATQAGSKEIISALADAGANLNAHRDRESHEPNIIYPPQNAHLLDLHELLANMNQQREPGSNETALHMAVNLERADLIKHLLDLGADPKEKSSGGNTPFHSACFNAFIEGINEFLERGIELEATNDKGATPLMSAIDGNHAHVVLLLIQKGAQASVISTEGWSALHLACQKGNPTIVALLLSAGAPVEPVDGQGATPLHLGALAGNTDIVHLLITHKADILANDIHGFTAAHRAALNGLWDIVECFLSAGFQWDTRTVGGDTLLHCAAARGQQQLCTQLLPWIVRQKLAHDSAIDHRERIRYFDLIIKKGALGGIAFPQEVFECFFSCTSSMREEVVQGSSFGLKGPRFYQNLLKRMTTLCRPFLALTLLREYAQSCFSQACSLTNTKNETAYAIAQRRFPEAAPLVNPDFLLDISMLREWLSREQEKHGSNAEADLFFKPDTKKAKNKPQAEQQKRCFACNKAGAPKRCGQCKLVVFCDANCLKNGWPKHKTTCKKA